MRSEKLYRHNTCSIRFGVFVTVSIHMVVFLVVTAGTDTWLPAFQRDILPPTSGQMTVCSSEMLVPTTRPHADISKKTTICSLDYVTL